MPTQWHLETLFTDGMDAQVEATRLARALVDDLTAKGLELVDFPPELLAFHPNSGVTVLKTNLPDALQPKIRAIQAFVMNHPRYPRRFGVDVLRVDGMTA